MEPTQPSFSPNTVPENPAPVSGPTFSPKKNPILIKRTVTIVALLAIAVLVGFYFSARQERQKALSDEEKAMIVDRLTSEQGPLPNEEEKAAILKNLENQQSATISQEEKDSIIQQLQSQ